MSRIRLYLDEDAMDGDLVRGLASRRVDVVTAHVASMINRTDQEHLEIASAQGLVLYSYDVGDFFEIHSNWIAAARPHAGIIVSRQQRYSVGEQIRRSSAS